MSLGKRFLAFCDRNVVLIAGGALIIGIHYSWWRIQNVPVFVDPSEKKELPVIIAAKYMGNKIVGEYDKITQSESKD